MRAVIVAAVSTEAQAAEERASIPDQLLVCRRACGSHGWQIVAEVIIPGHSRDYVWLDELEADCPEYRQWLDLVRADGCDVVVVRHYDRLWRTSPLQGQVMALCTQHRAQVYSVLQPQEPVPPDQLRQRRGLSGIMELLSGALSEEEQKLRMERREAGVRKMIGDGKPGCWAIAPTGYRRVEGMLEVDPEWAPVIQEIFRQRAEGAGVIRIMKDLNDRGIASRKGLPWTLRAVHRILRNPTYIGAVFSGQYYNPDGLHEPIISKELWDRVQDVNRVQYRRSPRHEHALSGLLRCGYCDWSLTYAHQAGRVNVRCTQYASTGGRVCQSNSHASHIVEGAVLTAVQDALKDRDAWAAAQRRRLDSDVTERELAMLRRQRESAEGQRSRLLDAYQIGALPKAELTERVNEIAQRLQSLDARINELSVTRQQIEAFCATLAGMNGMAERLPDLTPRQQRRVYSQLIDHVKVTRKDLAIHWRV